MHLLTSAYIKKKKCGPHHHVCRFGLREHPLSFANTVTHNVDVDYGFAASYLFAAQWLTDTFSPPVYSRVVDMMEIAHLRGTFVAKHSLQGSMSAGLRHASASLSHKSRRQMPHRMTTNATVALLINR